MTTPAKPLPDWCCASGCKRCEAWAVYMLTAPEEIEPPSAWCAQCNATTYRDAAHRCLSCATEAA